MSSNSSLHSELWRDLSVAIVVLIFGIGGWLWAQQFPARAMLWPNIIFIALMLIGLGYMSFFLIKVIVVGPKGKIYYKASEEPAGEGESGSDNQRLVYMMIFTTAVIAYLVIFPVIGFYSATYLFLLAAPLALGYRNYFWMFGYSTVTIISLWLVFTFLLNRNLPAEFFL